jgi:phage shock protein C
MAAKLYRSRSDRMLSGVCGGLGQYLGIDSTLVRLFFVLLTLGPGVGVVIYLALWLIVPLEGEPGGVATGETVRAGAGEIAQRAHAVADELREDLRHPNPRAIALAGGVLIGMGVILLLQNLDVAWLRWLSFDLLWPALLIVAGVALLVHRR